MVDFFSRPSGTTLATPQRIARNQQLSSALAQTALAGGPIQSPLQGVGRLARALASRTLSGRAEDQQKARQDAANRALMELLGGGGVGGAPAGAGVPIVPGSAPGGAPTAGGTPGLTQLIQTQQKFPELSGTLAPLIAARMKPTDPTKGVVVGAGGRLVNPVTGEVIAEGGPRAMALREIADPSSPTGTRLVPVAEAAGKPGPPGSSERFETITTPDGRTITRLVRGRGAGAGGEAAELTKPTTTSLEKNIVQANERLARIRNIRESFDPAFLNLPNQMFTKGAAMAERFGVELGPETKQRVAEFTEFRTNTLQNLNRTLNELSGAAVSPAEAERLKAELPTETDSPTEFAAKVQNIERQLEAAIARNQQLLEGGVRELKFGKNGEILNAPSLEEFMVRQDEQQNVSRETTQPTAADLGGAPEGTGRFSDMDAAQIKGVPPEDLTRDEAIQLLRRMDELGVE